MNEQTKRVRRLILQADATATHWRAGARAEWDRSIALSTAEIVDVLDARDEELVVGVISQLAEVAARAIQAACLLSTAWPTSVPMPVDLHGAQTVNELLAVLTPEGPDRSRRS